MTPMISAVLKAGLINEKQLAEFKRFGSPCLDSDAKAETPDSPEEVVNLISSALQSEGFVLVRETDLEVVHNYLNKSEEGVLHLESLEGAKDDVSVRYCKTPLGEYVIPWNGDGISDLLINGQTYLIESNGFKGVTFDSTRELFFGQQKAFVVCRPREDFQIST